MGTLTYDSTITAEFDDRLLNHLQVVIWSKLRRGEHFAFTFSDEAAQAKRTSVWCSPDHPDGVPVRSAGSDRAQPAWWSRLLTKSANSAGGPAAAARARRSRVVSGCRSTTMMHGEESHGHA
jgi:hypothetical protein